MMQARGSGPRRREGSILGEVYLFCFLVGGFFVGAAALHGPDTDADLDADVDGDLLDLDIDPATGAAEGAAGSLHLDMDTELAALPDAAEVPAEHAADLMVVDHGDHDVTHGAEVGDAVWMPLLSLRFWTYGSCFFGLTGGVLTLLELVPALTTLGLASGMGLACGYTASWTFQRLRRLQVSTTIGPRHYTGAVGDVLVPCGPGTPGKVRVRLRGQTIDLLAEAEEEEPLPRGTRVVVVAYEEGAARVVHAGRLLAGLRDDDEDDD